MAKVSPVVIAHNLVVPFLVAIMEEYFRATFVALLRYSPARQKILGSIRLTAADLTSDDSEEPAIEVAVQRISFQQMKKVHENFRALDNRIDVAGWLRKPYRRRRESLFAALERIANQRHVLVHRAELAPYYGREEAERDIQNLEVAITRVYHHLVRCYGWAAP